MRTYTEYNVSMFVMFYKNIIVLGIIFIDMANGNDVMISSGLGGWTHSQLWSQYTSFKAYSDMKIINTVSILAYNIDENGMLATYATNDTLWDSETYQQYIKQQLGVKSIPCIYCDATIGLCSNLSERLENLYTNMPIFINDTIARAKKFGWDGYIVDFEPDNEVNTTKITDFMIEWSSQLNLNNVSLSLWIGGNAPYEERIYEFESINFITMNTYTSSYDDFIAVAGPLQIEMIDIKKLGFGLLTNYGTKSFGSVTNNSDIMKIINWSLYAEVKMISLWASHISPYWYKALKKFSHKKLKITTN